MYKAIEESCMSRLKGGRMAVLTCFIIAAVFLAMINLCGIITDKLFHNNYLMLKEAVSEGLIAAFALRLLKITAGFKKLHGGAVIQLKRIRKLRILSAFVGAVIIQLFRSIYGHTFAELRSIGEVLSFALLVLFIGIAEEAVFRGVIAESMLRTFGYDKEGRHFAAFISGIIFGMAHLQNMIGADAAGVLVQSVGASVVGILFAEIYYSCRSLKPVIILHAGIDFFAMLEFGLFEGTSPSQIISTYSPWMIIPYVIIFMMWLGYSKFHNAGEVCA